MYAALYVCVGVCMRMSVCVSVWALILYAFYRRFTIGRSDAKRPLVWIGTTYNVRRTLYRVHCTPYNIFYVQWSLCASVLTKKCWQWSRRSDVLCNTNVGDGSPLSRSRDHTVLTRDWSGKHWYLDTSHPYATTSRYERYLSRYTMRV